MPTLFQVKSFLTYWLDAVDRHSLHSPFFFDLHKIITAPPSENFNTIESLRQQLIQSDLTVTVNDLGSGSEILTSAKRNVKDIARVSLSPPRFLQLYNRIIHHYQAKRVIELGTSLGVSTLYLANNAGVEVTTFEGAEEIALIAQDTFSFAKSHNIKLVRGNIDTTLPNHLQHVRSIDIAFMDANHRYEPTLRYFNWLAQKTHERSVIIMDDIHYSQDMENAWNEIKKNKLVYATADLYRCGLVFFDPSLNRQHVVLQF